MWRFVSGSRLAGIAVLALLALAARAIPALALATCAAAVVTAVAVTDRLSWLPHPAIPPSHERALTDQLLGDEKGPQQDEPDPRGPLRAVAPALAVMKRAGAVPDGEPAAQPQRLGQLPQAGHLFPAAEPPRHVEMDQRRPGPGSQPGGGPDLPVRPGQGTLQAELAQDALHSETCPPPRQDDGFALTGRAREVTDAAVNRVVRGQVLTERDGKVWPGLPRKSYSNWA